ncbi:MAG: ORF6N domain-containing protein [Alphaproteobacteria bacterium]|nr:ORF6N domain-containing protein [Alphaproteobacteria bacterium]
MLQELDANIGGPIENKIYTIRGTQVMLDFELAMIYGYSTKAFNQQIKNNKERFDDDFMFQLTDNEAKFLRSKILTTNFSPKSRSLPYAFTEQGIYMLMTVLKGELAVTQSKMLIRMFKEMKHILQNNKLFFDEIVSIKQHQIKADERIDELFSLMDKYNIEEKQGIFFQGQIFDAYAKFESFIQSAAREIILIDGFVVVRSALLLKCLTLPLFLQFCKIFNNPITPMSPFVPIYKTPRLTIIK